VDGDSIRPGNQQKVAALSGFEIVDLRLPPRAPNANAVGERIVRTIRTECLDHLIVIDERHLRAVLAEFADYYNRDRPHRSLRLESPLPSSVQAHGRVVSRPILGGLHHVYARAA
jgi:Integrase core domain